MVRKNIEYKIIEERVMDKVSKYYKSYPASHPTPPLPCSMSRSKIALVFLVLHTPCSIVLHTVIRRGKKGTEERYVVERTNTGQ